MGGPCHHDQHLAVLSLGVGLDLVGGAAAGLEGLDAALAAAAAAVSWEGRLV